MNEVSTFVLTCNNIDIVIFIKFIVYRKLYTRWIGQNTKGLLPYK